jgi:NADPH-dependent 7-cyano-7-deazaguanine reductase QueF-like protein
VLVLCLCSVKLEREMKKTLKTLTLGRMEKSLCSMYHHTLLEPIKKHNRIQWEVNNKN